MNEGDVVSSIGLAKILRITAAVTSVLLLPPFFVLAIAPMLLMLVPVAIVGLPFIIPAMFPASYATYSDDRLHARLRPAPRPVLVVS